MILTVVSGPEWGLRERGLRCIFLHIRTENALIAPPPAGVLSFQQQTQMATQLCLHSTGHSFRNLSSTDQELPC